MLLLRRVAGLLLTLPILCPVGAAAEPVGAVGRMAGLCLSHRIEPPQALLVNAPVERDEVVSTGGRSRLQIVFRDRSELTLGEHAKVRIDQFVYQPGAPSRMRAAAVGALRFISGAWQPGDSPDIVVTTPVASIAVRGTDFWTGPIDGQFGVLLLEGTVEVSAGGGIAVLDEPGEGVTIAAEGAPPGPVTQWPQDRVERALAAVAIP